MGREIVTKPTTRPNQAAHTVYRDGCLGDVCGDDTLALAGWRGVENATLHLGRKLRVHGVNVEFRNEFAEAFEAFVEERTR